MKKKEWKFKQSDMFLQKLKLGFLPFEKPIPKKTKKDKVLEMLDKKLLTTKCEQAKACLLHQKELAEMGDENVLSRYTFY